MALSQTLVDGANRVTATSTFTAAPIGTAAAGRVVVVLFLANTPGSITGGSIGGVTGTIENDPSGISIMSAIVPTGTTGNIVVTGSGGFQTIGTWTISGGPDLVPTSFVFNSSGTGSISINVVAGGCVFGTAVDESSATTTPLWSGLTNEGSPFTVSAGATQSQPAGKNFATAQTVSCTVTGCVFPVEFLVAFGPHVLAGAEGAFIISGKAAALNAARKLGGAEGAFTISGKAATLAHTVKLSGAEGSFAISGQAATLNKALHLGGAEGAFTISGHAATLTLTTSGHFTLAGAEGSFSISGQAAALAAARKLAGVEGSFAISGQASGMLRGINLPGGEGAFAISGGVATVTRSIHLGSVEGAFVIGGQAATLGHGSKLASAEGAFVISGQPARFPVALSVKGAEGTFVIGGGPAVLSYTPATGGGGASHSNPFFSTPGPGMALP